MRRTTRYAFRTLILISCFGALCLAQEPAEPVEIVRQLSEFGPRIPGSPGHRAAREWLSNALTEAGVEAVRPEIVSGPETWTHLVGDLPGTAETLVVVSAHYDTVAGSSGVDDNASGCAVALTAVSDLARTPRQSGTRLLLTDGEERLAAGSREWLAKRADGERQRILANLNLDMLGNARGGAGVVHLLAGEGSEGRAITPAWLVHAILRAAAGVDFDLVVLDRWWSWWAQLAVRCSRPLRISDGHRFVEAGVPAATLSDLSMTGARQPGADGEDSPDVVDAIRLSSWAQVVAATVRRLDRLAGRPRDESEYLVLFGRVWTRRDLVWLGFLVWMLLVWRGLPGRWRQRPVRERRQAGRAYLPGFAFRMLFLVSVFLIPTFMTLLLLPVALVALVGPARTGVGRRVSCLLGGLPICGFSLWLAVGQLAGWFVIDAGVTLPATLVGLTLTTFCFWQSGN
jgi:hypothetical protein